MFFLYIYRIIYKESSVCVLFPLIPYFSPELLITKKKKKKSVVIKYHDNQQHVSCFHCVHSNYCVCVLLSVLANAHLVRSVSRNQRNGTVPSKRLRLPAWYGLQQRSRGLTALLVNGLQWGALTMRAAGGTEAV